MIFFKIKKTLYTYFRTIKQRFKINSLLLKNNVVVVPANSTFRINKLNYIKDKYFIFTNLSQGRYELIIRHKSNELYENRKLAWASFEISGAAISSYIAQKLGLIMGEKDIFSYVGGGRYRNGIYHSRTNINIYKKTSFVIIKFNTTYKGELDIQEIELVRQDHQPMLDSTIDEKSITVNEFIINHKNLNDKLYHLFHYNTYIVYANISPNVADGSSIWLSSIVDIVATNNKVILVLKENLRSDIIISNIVNKDNVTILQPQDYSNNNDINEKQALEIIRNIDFIHPKLRGVLVRGVVAANELVSDRVFKYRTVSYLTDFYEVIDGSIVISDIKEQFVKNIALHSHLMLIQTKEIQERLFTLLGYQHQNFAYLPPSLPDSMFESIGIHNSSEYSEYIKIGYAGKIMPNWGVEELLNWVVEFNKNNKKKIKLFIAANKISAPGEQRKPFAGKIKRLLLESEAIHYTNLNREQCINLLKGMDYVWAFRPGYFENVTLEFSTKLLEALAMGQKVICYPSKIHIDELGEDYPFYVKDKKDFYQLVLSNKASGLDSLVKHLKEKHSISNVARRLSTYQPFNLENDIKNSELLCFSGHDFKFIDPYISYLKSYGINVIRDVWEWGKPANLELSKEMYRKSQVIFCEWGLANAVYFSNNNPDGKALYIRVHLQEINERARKFGKQINFENVTKVIFVSENVRNEYIKLFNVPIEKTVVIPNFVLEDEYSLIKNDKNGKNVVTLGMVGIVPQRKRFDRAVNLLEQLNKRGVNAELHIKGHRPENLEFMKGTSRIKELDYYYEVYNKIKEKGLESKVIFSSWGNDVALWYKNIDFILSPSDFESFHYALADGVLSGSIPVVWNWSEAVEIYKDSWIVSSDEQATDYVMKYINQDNHNLISKNRDFIIQKYGKNRVFSELSKIILGELR